MLKQIDFKLSGIDYIMLYDSDNLTDEQALAECEFVGWGLGKEQHLFPHYLIVEKLKMPILQTIKDHVRDKAYQEGYEARMECEEYLNDV